MPVRTKTNDLKVADQCWVGLASLHREHPHRQWFTPAEILDRIRKDAGGELRPGVSIHISAHNVANVAPNPGNYRMFVRLPDKTYRLYRPGDQIHPLRRGKSSPNPEDLPHELQPLLEWYKSAYCKPGLQADEEDAVIAMLGVGKHLWKKESGDEFIRRERSEW